ncbi:hypothetical protein PG994_010421 [Apiospora phragmitis]|uniref:Uncharacterized protein n=1 Tax=Apiospora phragmitis TaxID=2905665 RepID=A0ABR1TPW9_9PEZI
MSKPWIFVSPANRGIGAALTRHLLRATTLPIVATSRSTSPSETKKALLADLSLPPSSSSSFSSSATQQHDHDRLTVLPLDVTSESSIEQASDQAAALFPPERGRWHMHLGFALPGVLYPERSPRQVEYAAALETFQVNTLGPLMLMKWFADRFLPRKGTELLLPSSPSSSPHHHHQNLLLTLPPHATWTTLSARLSSIADNTLGGWYSYRASKAGVNQLTKTFDLHLARQRSQDRAMALAYHPGTVRTDFTREFWTHVPREQLFDVDYAVERLVDVVVAQAQLDTHRGRCWDWKGEEVLP